MKYGILITAAVNRIEQINARLLAAQCEIGGCIVYVGDSTLRWEVAEDESDGFEFVTAILDILIEMEVFDPAVDQYEISGEENHGGEYTWSAGFAHGFKNGLAFRNNSIPALQHALNEAEGKVKEEATRANCYADENHVLRNLRDKLGPLLQSTGDGIANIFDQMQKGNWVDDHGHRVENNIHMLAMQSILLAIMHFRTDHLDYEKGEHSARCEAHPVFGSWLP